MLNRDEGSSIDCLIEGNVECRELTVRVDKFGGWELPADWATHWTRFTDSLLYSWPHKYCC